MKRITFAALTSLTFTMSVSAENVRSDLMRKAICKDVESHIKHDRTDTLDASVAECASKATFKIQKKSKNYSTYSGPDISIKVGDKKVSYKKDQKLLTSLEVVFRFKSFHCELEVERTMPKFVISGDSIHFNESNWNTDVNLCSVVGEVDLSKIQPGDKNLKIIENFPSKAGENIFSYDIIPMIGHDGYYGDLEESYAKILDADKKTIGYMMAMAFDYSEDPEIHYWVFVFNLEGKMVELPEQAYTGTGDDWLWQGSTEELIKTGTVDY